MHYSSDLEISRHWMIDTGVNCHLVIVNRSMQSSVDWDTCVEVREIHATHGDKIEVSMHEWLPLV